MYKLLLALPRPICTHPSSESGPGPHHGSPYPATPITATKLIHTGRAGRSKNMRPSSPFYFSLLPFYMFPRLCQTLSWGLGTWAAAARGWNEFPGIARAPQKWEGRDEKEGAGGTPTRMEEEFQFRAELERLFSLTFSALLPLGCLTKITPPVLFCAPLSSPTVRGRQTGTSVAGDSAHSDRVEA